MFAGSEVASIPRIASYPWTYSPHALHAFRPKHVEVTQRVVMAKISIVGSYPPNYGGISTHVQRLHLLMDGEHQCRVKDLYAMGGEPEVPGVDRIVGNAAQRVLGCRTQLKADAAQLEHFHVSAMRKFLWSTPVLLTGRARATRVLTIHGGAFPEVVAAFSGWEKMLFRWMLNQFDHFVCVSEKQRAVLDSWDVAADRVSVINAYLPPVASAESGTFQAIRDAKEQGRQVLVCAAQYLEHYGIEELSQAMISLHEELGDAVPLLALVSYAEQDQSYKDKCMALRARMPEIVEFVNLNPEQVAELMALGNVFVRPTWWDGDAISVREAAFFGNRLVATNVTTRPEGTVLCDAKDAVTLHKALKTASLDPNAGVVSFDHEQSMQQLLTVYRSLGFSS